MINHHSKMVETLVSAGHLAHEWRTAVETTPRRNFVPPVAWLDTDDGWQRLDRVAEPHAWLAATCVDRSIVTQWDDGTISLEDGPGIRPTSSISQPSIVADMLREALIHDGDRVLEIGTGTGWNAAVLATRLGEKSVYSIEVDRQIAIQARTNLTKVDRYPTVVTADGSDGYRPGAPYDRVLSTASVFSVPYAWITQTRPGGYVVTPWRTALLNGLLLRLLVGADGTASGQFVGTAAFMGVRSQRAPSEAVDIGGIATERETDVHPGYIFNGTGAHCAVSLVVAHCYRWPECVDDGYVSRLEDPAGGSWATVTVPADSPGPYVVRQGGPRRLWDEVVSAYRCWQDIGEPELTRFGVTVDRDGQRVWLDDPDNVVGPILRSGWVRQ